MVKASQYLNMDNQHCIVDWLQQNTTLQEQVGPTGQSIICQL